MLSVSATTPSAANAASPCMRTGTTASQSGSEPFAMLSNCRDRAHPTTTGFTNSRWLGFGASVTLTVPTPSISRVPLAPLWYFTSPVPATWSWLPWYDGPSNSARSSAYETPTVWVSTLSRPRCAMPSTTSRAPASATCWMSTSSIGTSMSVPSSENRFWPRYARWRNCSSPSTSQIRRRSAFFSSGPSSGKCALASTWSHSQSTLTWSSRCSNSYPIEPA